MMAENGGREKRDRENGGEEMRGKDKDGKGKRGISAELSVWALLARSSFYKVLAVVFLMAIVEAVLFYHTLRGGWIAPLEVKIEEEIGARRVFLLALGVVFIILIRMEGILDSAGRYTMMRLRIARERLFVIKTAYNVLCLLMLFVVQTGLVFWFARLYGRVPEIQGMEGMADGGSAAGQMVFFAFYRSEFLHGVFPMAEVGKWVRNGLMLLAFGMEAAGGFGRRHQATQAALFVLSAACFAGSIGTEWSDIVCGVAFAVTIGADLWGAYDFRREMRPCRETGRSGSA